MTVVNVYLLFSRSAKPRITSAPLIRPKSVPKTVEVLPTMKTRVKSSIRSRRAAQTNEQPFLNTIMVHLDSNPPSNASKWSIYQNIQNKFSASVSPQVYRNFERS